MVFSYGVGVYSGVEALYVHIMAVNEGAKLFYELHGFITEQEESSNQAHYRYKGHHQSVLKVEDWCMLSTSLY